MAVLRGYVIWLRGLFCLLYFSYCRPQVPNDLSSITLLTGNCDNDVVYRKLFDVSLYECATECLRRARCHHILYKEELKYCGLINETHIATAQDHNVAQCLYVNVDNMDFSVSLSTLGQCVYEPCSLTQRCSFNGTTYYCEFSECLEPPHIENGTLMSNVEAVGDNTSYRCEWPLVLDGPNDLHITCMRNGQWSNPGLKCAQTCPLPKGRLINAALVDVSNPRMTAGTSLRYDCETEYQGLGTSDELTCTSSGNWSKPAPTCCQNGYELYNHACIKIRHADQATMERFFDMREACRLEGSVMANSTQVSAEYIVERHTDVEDLAFRDNKPSFSYPNLSPMDQNCVSQSVSPGTNMTAMSVDALVELGRGASCDFATKWFQGEPNGGAGENCLFAAAWTHYLLVDVPCRGMQLFQYSFVCIDFHPI